MSTEILHILAMLRDIRYQIFVNCFVEPPILEMAPAGAMASKRVSRDGLDLPLTVECNVTRTQSLSTRNGGHKVLRTVTSMDEMIKLSKLQDQLPSCCSLCDVMTPVV